MTMTMLNGDEDEDEDKHVHSDDHNLDHWAEDEDVRCFDLKILLPVLPDILVAFWAAQLNFSDQPNAWCETLCSSDNKR